MRRENFAGRVILWFHCAMQIDQQKCVACGNCVPVCPMGAISIDPAKNRAAVNGDECVECYTCFRGMSMENLNPTLVRGIRRLLKAFRLRFDPEPDVCPTSAITPDELVLAARGPPRFQRSRSSRTRAPAFTGAARKK